jgi:hypothetical protein
MMVEDERLNAQIVTEGSIDIAIKMDVDQGGDDYLNRVLRRPIDAPPKHFHMTLGYIKNVSNSIAINVASQIKAFLDSSHNLQDIPQEFIIDEITTWHRTKATKDHTDDKTLILFTNTTRKLRELNTALNRFLQEMYGEQVKLDQKTQGDTYIPHIKLGRARDLTTHQAILTMEHVLEHERHTKKDYKSRLRVSFSGYSFTLRKPYR